MVAICSCAALAPTYGAPAVSERADFVDGIIVKYRDATGGINKARNVGAELAARFNVGLSYKRQMARGAHVMSLDAPKTRAAAEAIARQLATDPRVMYAEPDYRMYPLQAAVNDDRYDLQWHLWESVASIRVEGAWQRVTGAGAVVAVIDTGYLPHADLAANLLTGYDFISSMPYANDGDGRDANAQDPGDWLTQGEIAAQGPFQVCGPAHPVSSWHGTHVAGTVVAVANNGIGIAGAAYDARVLPVRVLGKCGGATSDIVDAMLWAAGISVPGVTANPNPAHVLNLSLGGQGSCSQSYADAIAAVRAVNVSVVVAAGNTNENVTNAQPADCPGVISVAAINRAGGKASYSNFGALVDLAAPGGEAIPDPNLILNAILTLSNTGQTTPGSDAYKYREGTSSAAPHVAGVAALLYSYAESKGMTLTPDQVEKILRDTARPFPQACSGCGTGIVDATAAVARLEGMWIARWLPSILTILE
jgi:serine protease